MLAKECSHVVTSCGRVKCAPSEAWRALPDACYHVLRRWAVIMASGVTIAGGHMCEHMWGHAGEPDRKLATHSFWSA